MLLKAVNGKHLAYGEYFDNEESVKEAIGCNHIKRQPVVTEK
jgi:hypothetical protein